MLRVLAFKRLRFLKVFRVKTGRFLMSNWHGRLSAKLGKLEKIYL